jgi:hypothetical protein
LLQKKKKRSILKKPSLKECERLVGSPALRWKKRCYEIATLFVNAGIVDGVAVYGHWLGPIHPNSCFAAKSAAGFCRHGWVKLADGSIVDPTRWCFEAVSPYVFHGPNCGKYDEGGNQLRAKVMGPPPEFDPFEARFDASKNVMDYATWNFVEKFLDVDYAFTDQEPGTLTRSQLFYLANSPPDVLGVHTAGVYNWLIAVGRKAAIPIDNFMKYEREYAESTPVLQRARGLQRR